MAAGGITVKPGNALLYEAGLWPGLAGFHGFALSVFMVNWPPNACGRGYDAGLRFCWRRLGFIREFRKSASRAL